MIFKYLGAINNNGQNQQVLGKDDEVHGEENEVEGDGGDGWVPNDVYEEYDETNEAYVHAKRVLNLSKIILILLLIVIFSLCLYVYFFFK